MDEQIKKQIDFFWRYEIVATTENTRNTFRTTWVSLGYGSTG
jgi:hypothetical protein